MSAPCSACTCPAYETGINPNAPCIRQGCGHPREVHIPRPGEPGLQTSVLKPVTVKNTGHVVLVFVGDKETFKLAPGETRLLAPGNYRVQVDIITPGPIVIVIAKIVYDHKYKKFDIQAEDGMEGARFVTMVDLEAIKPHPHAAAAATAEA